VINQLDPVTGKVVPIDEFVTFVVQSSATEAVPTQAVHNHISIDGDHRSMTKFSKKTDQNFLKVSKVILSLVEVAKVILETQSLKIRMFTISDLSGFRAPLLSQYNSLTTYLIVAINFRSQDGHPTHFVIPYQKNEKYTPRSSLENVLSRTCKSDKKVVLLGPGGTG
jgi:hypothetical protein